MKNILTTVACTLPFLSGSAFAESDWNLSGNFGLVSDYMFRGVTQTDSNPAIQGGLDLSHENGFFAGVWGSNVEGDMSDSTVVNYNGVNLELDVYLGWSAEVADKTTVTVKALRYNYPGTHYGPNNSNEFSLYVGRDFPAFSANLGINYSDDYYGLDEATYLDLGVSIPVGPVTVSLHYGAQEFAHDAFGGDDYEDYSVGVSGTAAGLNLGLAYTGSRGVAGTNVTRQAYDGAVVFSVFKDF